MNIRLYYPNSIVENTTALLSKEHTHYVVNVMRLKRGSKINFFNNQGEWKSEIIFLDKDRVEVKFLKKIKESSSKISNIELAICLVKKNPMEIILQKATELGISKITPIISERTEIKDLNFDRAKKIVIESTEQSNQLYPPQISKITRLEDYIKNFNIESELLFADVNAKNNLKDIKLKVNNSKSLLIGPEGDFSPDERNLILSKENTISFSLSKNILRTDTAAIGAITILNYHLNFK